ncbi:MAG TPA: hypothetical protein PK495_08310, partial [Bacteroidales bacterium]|nr:hypothetical protein [Bacteroidales bacterium]
MIVEINIYQLLLVLIPLFLGSSGLPTIFFIRSEKKRKKLEIEKEETQNAAADIQNFAAKITIYEKTIESVEKQYNKLFQSVESYENKIKTLEQH